MANNSPIILIFPVKENASEDELAKYREGLVAAEQESQDQYDKAMLSLSGGALGLTFAFVDKVVPFNQAIDQWLLLLAWTCWGTSILSTLLSFLSSRHALRTAIEQVDAGTIYQEKPGKWWDQTTSYLNIGSAVAFTLGVLLLILFVADNVL